MKRGFTLAELLIALAILGVIATFTIPKVLNSQQDGKYKAMAKETVSAVSEAFSNYQKSNTVTGNESLGVLTPYLNYVSIHTSTLVIDDEPSGTSRACSATSVCLRLHN